MKIENIPTPTPCCKDSANLIFILVMCFFLALQIMGVFLYSTYCGESRTTTVDDRLICPSLLTFTALYAMGSLGLCLCVAIVLRNPPKMADETCTLM